jgi:hypothetical protein
LGSALPASETGGATTGSAAGGSEPFSVRSKMAGSISGTAGMNSDSIAVIFACRDLRRLIAVSTVTFGLACKARSSAANAER